MTALGSMDWQGELDEGRRRRLQRAVAASAGAHVAVVILLSLSPSPGPLALPQAITVDLVAALPSPAPASAAKPAPKPAPAAKPAPPPPPPKQKVKILPKDAPAPVAKPEPAAKPETKAEPISRRPERPKELSYDDALAKLRGELGDEANSPLADSLARAETTSTVPSAGKPSAGALVSPEVAAWNLAVIRHIRSVWITPPEFRDRGLAAQLEIEVAVDGQVLGTPELVRSSGNPYFDDNAVRAVVRASPLPGPPRAGRQTLIFTAEE